MKSENTIFLYEECSEDIFELDIRVSNNLSEEEIEILILLTEIPNPLKTAYDKC